MYMTFLLIFAAATTASSLNVTLCDCEKADCTSMLEFDDNLRWRLWQLKNWGSRLPTLYRRTGTSSDYRLRMHNLNATKNHRSLLSRRRWLQNLNTGSWHYTRGVQQNGDHWNVQRRFVHAASRQVQARVHRRSVRPRHKRIHRYTRVKELCIPTMEHITYVPRMWYIHASLTR